MHFGWEADSQVMKAEASLKSGDLLCTCCTYPHLAKRGRHQIQSQICPLKDNIGEIFIHSDLNGSESFHPNQPTNGGL